MSERAAVARTIRADSKAKVSQSEILRLVMETVAHQDLADIVARPALPSLKRGTTELCLARLAASISIVSLGLSEEVIAGLRQAAPVGFRPRLEYLFGMLETFDNQQVYDGPEDSGRVALRTHHTQWWVDYCFRVFGRWEAVRLLGSPARPRYVRVNSLRNRGRLTIPQDAKYLAGSLEKISSFTGIYKLSGSLSSFSPFFSSGLFQLQDLASFAAVVACDPKPRESVIDLCSAPGAKTGALAQLMKNKGRIVSVDYSRSRLNTWSKEMQRLGVGIAVPLEADASRLGLIGQHDLVLVDPPCSGTGVFDRNPRMKWHLTAERVERYSKLQSLMLEEAYKLLGPEGRIVYCTCSVTVEENEEVVSRFLDSHPEMETRPILIDTGYGSAGLRGLSNCRRFFPHSDGTAGYFIARLERAK